MEMGREMTKKWIKVGTRARDQVAVIRPRYELTLYK